MRSLAFVDDTPTTTFVRQVLGAVAQLDKAMTVAKLRGARERKRRQPQPGRGCRARFLVRHNYSNSPNVPRTEVAIAFGGQIGARFTWTMDGEWDDLLMRIVNEDQRWVAKIAERRGGRG